jgi:hypothetical protein
MSDLTAEQILHAHEHDHAAFNALVAEHVMGWKRCSPLPGWIPKAKLAHVLWHQVWEKRRQRSFYKQRAIDCYEPGDYSLAALLTFTETKA